MTRPCWPWPTWKPAKQREMAPLGDTAREIITYVLRDMTAPEGVFFSAEDADSEGEEGKFYVWTEEELRKALPADEADFAIHLYGAQRDGNFNDEATQAKTGRNILHLSESPDTAATRLGLSHAAFLEKKEAVRQALFSSRKERIHPQKDDKILTDWNGLMIAALASGSRIFQQRQYLEKARAAVAFIFANLQDKQGRLRHSWRHGQPGGPGNLDDYAFLIWGLIECYEASLDPADLERAVSLQNQLDLHFWDEQNGGYYFTADDGEQVIARQKDIYDGAIPSGNAVAMLNLIRLSRLTGNEQWEARAEGLGKAFSGLISRAPSGFTMFMVALAWIFHNPLEIVIAGDPADPDTARMLDVVRNVYIPNKTVLFRPFDDTSGITRLAPFTKDMIPVNGKVTAYVCSGRTCQAPTTDPDMLAQLLKGKKPLFCIVAGANCPQAESPIPGRSQCKGLVYAFLRA